MSRALGLERTGSPCRGECPEIRPDARAGWSASLGWPEQQVSTPHPTVGGAELRSSRQMPRSQLGETRPPSPASATGSDCHRPQSISTSHGESNKSVNLTNRPCEVCSAGKFVGPVLQVTLNTLGGRGSDLRARAGSSIWIRRGVRRRVSGEPRRRSARGARPHGSAAAFAFSVIASVKPWRWNLGPWVSTGHAV